MYLQTALLSFTVLSGVWCKVILRNNGYDGVQVALEDSIPVSLCQEVIRGLEALFRSSSSVLFRATRGRASFRSVDVILPSSWTPDNCALVHGLREVRGAAWDQADVRVTRKNHPVFGARPWAQQSQGCAHHGDYVSMALDLLLTNHTAKGGRLLAQAWLKHRYGVFEEMGSEGSIAHPPAYRAADSTWAPTVCSTEPLVNGSLCPVAVLTCHAKADLRTTITGSFLAFPELEQVTDLCDEGTHNPFAPTQHNLLCRGKSAWEVIRASEDFQNNRNVEGLARPSDVIFSFTKGNSPKIILAIEDTSVMNVQKRWDFLRKAIRKLVTYDVPSDFSVGLVVYDSRATVKYPLQPLADDEHRFNLGSSLPRNPSRVDKHRRCTLCGIQEALKILTVTGGVSGGHVVLILAESSSIPEREVQEVERLFANSNSVLHVIVYPMTERFPQPPGGLEQIASNSGGLSFTVPDEGIGSDSKLVMYYNLLDSLYHTVSVAAGKGVLPIKIHSAEHRGGLLQSSEGSFWVDPGLGEDTVLAIFYYKVGHVGDVVHLISPDDQVIDTRNMQKEDDNMNMITIRLKESQEAHGLWHYKIENRADSHQSLYVQVTSRPHSHPDSPRVDVRSWHNQPFGTFNVTDAANPLIIFVEVRAGLAPVERATVQATLKHLGAAENGSHYDPILISLLDDGLLSPDIKKEDGIYSRYVLGLIPGKYSVLVRVEGYIDNQKFMRQLNLGVIDAAGSLVPDYPPSMVSDLRAAVLPDSSKQVSFAWTAPGADFDYFQANAYTVMMSNSHTDVQDKKGKILQGWPSPLPAHSSQQHTVTWHEFDSVFYVGLFATDSQGNSAPMSNIVEVFVPKPLTTPSTLSTSEPSASEVNLYSEYDGAKFVVSSSFNTKHIAVIFGCLGVFAVISVIIACYCVTQHKRSKKPLDKGCEVKDNFNVTVTLDAGSDYPGGKEGFKECIKKEFISPMESWSPSQLLGGQQDKMDSVSGRSDNSSNHSGSTKKSYGGSEPPQYYANSPQYPFSSEISDAYPVPSDGYPTPTEEYRPTADTYPQDDYSAEVYQVGSNDGRSYVDSQPDSFLSLSCDMLPGSRGPPGYSAHPYDSSLRGAKVPPPIPPKPKVVYTPEPYLYDVHDVHEGDSFAFSEKRVRNVTMV